MTDDGDALLAAIIAHPAEDTPRLMYADWLEEHGQHERAEFTRVQCELARRDAAHLPPHDPCTCSRERLPDAGGRYCGACGRRNEPIAALRRRERDLLESGDTEEGHWGRWSDWLPQGPFVLPDHPHAALNMQCQFRRGFVEEVECRAADWLQHGDALCALHPVTRVTLRTVPEFIANTPFRISTGGRYGVVLARRQISLEVPEGRDVAKVFLEERWKGVTFELPPDPGGTPLDMTPYTLTGPINVPDELLADASSHNYASAIAAGAVFANEIRAAIGLPPIAGGDIPHGTHTFPSG